MPTPFGPRLVSSHKLDKTVHQSSSGARKISASNLWLLFSWSLDIADQPRHHPGCPDPTHQLLSRSAPDTTRSLALRLSPPPNKPPTHHRAIVQWGFSSGIVVLHEPPTVNTQGPQIRPAFLLFGRVKRGNYVRPVTLSCAR